ncbi:hypothetical protein Mame_02460 [Martelella mediterranea DSM 17316]|uniref:Autotransporter domain-containing protein n=1 Tax=Martelella mediterranea DSM 17316 TaxID=1122214 RepID=A0A1U9Z287_9HYPH|nr:hypothetical protein Mame_02460 [Martelella mediterranea DSM 17316]
MSAKDALGVNYIPHPGGAANFNITGGTIEVEGTGNFGLGVTNYSTPTASADNYTTTVQIGVAASLTADARSYVFANNNDSASNILEITTSGIIEGDIMLGGGGSTFNLTGGSINGYIYGDFDTVYGTPLDTQNQGTDTLNWTAGTLSGGFFGGGGNDYANLSTLPSETGNYVFQLDGGESDNDSETNQDFDLLSLSNNEPLDIEGRYLTRWERIIIEYSTVNFTDTLLTLDQSPLGGNFNDLGDLFVNTGGTIETNKSGSSGTSFTLAGNLKLGGGAWRSYGQSLTIISGNVGNGGSLNLADGVVGGSFIIGGDYKGISGIIVIDTDFGRLTSDSARINGQITGTTEINVIPYGNAGSPGAIPIILTGANPPPEGSFQLEENGQPVSGIYQYDIYYILDDKNSGVYLASSDPSSMNSVAEYNSFLQRPGIRLAELIDAGVALQPYVPLYEAYQSVLLEMTRLPSLKTRSGGRYDGGAALSSGPALDAVWGRVGGGFDHFDPQSSTTGYDYDMSSFEMQAGLDGLFLDSAAGALVGGFTAHYQTGEAKVHSRYGDSKIHPDGYGFGGTLTWFGTNGFYTDAQAALTWYSSELKADDLPLSPDDSEAFGYALSLEAGQAFGIGDGVSLTPQAQLSFASVSVDSFTGAYSDDVDFDDGQSLLGRVGLSIEKESAWTDINGQARAANIYGLANLYYEFLGETTATVADVLDFSSEPDDFTGEIGFGGSIDWQAGKLQYSAFAELTASTGFSTGSYGYGGNVGLKVRW